MLDIDRMIEEALQGGSSPLRTLPPGTHVGGHRIMGSWGGVPAIVLPPISDDFDPETMSRAYRVTLVTDIKGAKWDVVKHGDLPPGAPVELRDSPGQYGESWRVKTRTGAGGYREAVGKLSRPEMIRVTVQTKELDPVEMSALQSHLRQQGLIDISGVYGIKAKKEADWKGIFRASSFDAASNLPGDVGESAYRLLQKVMGNSASWSGSAEDMSKKEEAAWRGIKGVYYSGPKYDTVKFVVRKGL